MSFRPAIVAVAGTVIVLVALAAGIAAAGSAGDSSTSVTLRAGSPGRRGHGMAGERVLLLDPNPLVLARNRKDRVAIGVEPGLVPAAYQVQMQFVPQSPFGSAAAQGSAEAPLALGSLSTAAELGRYPYTLRIQDETGAVVGEARGTVEVCETRSFPRPALMLAAAIGFLFLIANYAERRPLTRSYEHAH
ncbi:MAG TPA: hypothetical protein VNM87_12465 [Candidatus Udaeobacter sp.]|nr:hypothetical protein [Candidatus Udaeobacter sp.]